MRTAVICSWSLAMTKLTLGVGAISVYQVVARNLYGQLDQSLFNLADAAARSLAIGGQCPTPSTPLR